MKVNCPECKAIHEIDESKISNKGGYGKCRKCGTRFFIKSESNNEKITAQHKTENRISDRKEPIYCPKCNYKRQQNDIKCERCGVIYEKYKVIEQKIKPENIKQTNISKKSVTLETDFESEKREDKVVKTSQNKIVMAAIVLFAFIFLIYQFIISPYFDKQNCNKAYIALMKIEAATESGISYVNYTELLNSAKLELNLLKKKNSKRLKQINEIYDCYQKVKTLWSLNIEKDYNMIALIIIDMKKTDTDFKVDISSKEGYSIGIWFYNDTIQYLWKKGSKMLRNYE